MTLQNTQNANVGFPPAVTARQDYVNGGVISNNTGTPHTLLNIGITKCLDSGGQYDMYAAAGTVDFTINGLNGLDTGTIATSSQYAIYIIADSTLANPPGYIASLNFANAPTMPFTTTAIGYNLVRRIGFALTDGSGNLQLFDMLGNGLTKYVQWRTPIEVKASGTITSTFVAVPLTAGMPPLALPVQLSVIWTPDEIDDILYMRPTGSSSTNGVTIISGHVPLAANYAQPFYFQPLLATGQPSVDVKGTDVNADVLEMKVIAVTDLL